jgi:hypothetical protein
MGPLKFVVLLDLEAEAESESASKRGVLRRGDADPSCIVSTTVERIAVKALELFGSDKMVKTLAIVVVRSQRTRMPFRQISTRSRA